MSKSIFQIFVVFILLSPVSGQELASKPKPGADRATIMTMLEQRAGAEEIRQILEQCEADGTMDKIRALLAEKQTRKNREEE